MLDRRHFVKTPYSYRHLNRVLPKNPKAKMTWVTAQASHAWIIEKLLPELRERVTLKDWIPQEQLISLYDQHGLFLFPSFTEGFGKASLEAMTRGLCVVASGCRRHARPDLPRKKWLLCEPGNVEQFENGLNQLLNHPEKSKHGASWQHKVQSSSRGICTPKN